MAGGLQGDSRVGCDWGRPRVPSFRGVGEPAMRACLLRMNPIAMDRVLVAQQAPGTETEPPSSASRHASLCGAGRTPSRRRATGPEAGLMRGLAQHTPQQSRSRIAPGKAATPPAVGVAPHPHGWIRDSPGDAQLLSERPSAGFGTHHTHTTMPTARPAPTTWRTCRFTGPRGYGTHRPRSSRQSSNPDGMALPHRTHSSSGDVRLPSPPEPNDEAGGMSLTP
jgi:hypothetical protein